jgi:N-methylhydantoinase A/oxoprolinase/acetone carboxylase beta subunit
VRYSGQGHEVEVPLESDDDGVAVAARFVRAYRSRFGYTLDDARVEIVSARHAASGEPVAAAIGRVGASRWSDDDRTDDGGRFEAAVHGPATVALPDATMLVREGWTARALPSGGWLMERDS